jgi:2,4-dienoyl-CoA reductase-like NADH-dependent reductase (Old Yellow Enzyme family)
VRISAYDFVPFERGADGAGAPVAGATAPRYAFGSDASGVGVDLTETHRFLDLCRELGIGLVCVTAGSPYYNPHIQRPAYFPPTDGYAPPEDPLVGAARMIAAAAELAHAHPNIAIVGSGYSYLQQWIPNAAQHTVRTGGAASVGIGRGMLSYPGLPGDVLAGRALDASRLCRTFSDCTTAPRNGMVSGCYPLDEFYRERPERVAIARVKRSDRPNIRR